jgi:uncharacterized protein YqgC (DUF456 family)
LPLVIQKTLLVLLYAGFSLALLSTIVGLPGNWILVGAALVIGLATGFLNMTVATVFLCTGLALLAEAIESVLGAAIVAKRGGSKLGVVGSIVGGFVGVVLGGPFFPPVGSVLLGFVGAFLGAVLGEMLRQPDLGLALRIGFWSFIGRTASIAAKLSIGCVIFWLIVKTTWP